MKVYKVVLMVIDFDGLGGEEIKSVIENNRYPNHCMAPSVEKIEERDIGEWTDDHALNNTTTSKEEFARLFAETD